jgi:hypothetical protein
MAEPAARKNTWEGFAGSDPVPTITSKRAGTPAGSINKVTLFGLVETSPLSITRLNHPLVA